MKNFKKTLKLLQNATFKCKIRLDTNCLKKLISKLKGVNVGYQITKVRKIFKNDENFSKNYERPC